MDPVLWLLLSLFSLSNCLVLTKPDSLNKYLCDSTQLLLPDTEILLSSDLKHILSSSSFCLVSNTSNITLSSISETPATITCRQQSTRYPLNGFGFYNISGLFIKNVIVTKCGGPMPSTNKLYPNDTTFYFNEGQSVTLFVSYCSDIKLFRVAINNYYGFAILLINPNNNVTLNNVNITTSSTRAQFSDNRSKSCGGSGLILYFSNMYKWHKVLKASVLLNNTSIEGNLNIVPYGDISNAANVDDKRSKAISSFAAGMTVLFSQGNYSANIVMSHGYWKFNSGGLFDGIAFIFSDAPVGNTSITVTNSEFNHNIYSLAFDTFD